MKGIMSTGIIYLKIKIRLNSDLDEDEVQDFVNELDYEINDPNVCDTEIVDFDVE